MIQNISLIIALKRVIKHKDNLIKVNPHTIKNPLKNHLRSALTLMITGDVHIPEQTFRKIV